jgi:hypothetical protein
VSIYPEGWVALSDGVASVVVVTGGVVVALESPGGLVDVVVGACVVVVSGAVVVGAGTVVDVAGVDGSSPRPELSCGATMLPSVVPEPRRAARHAATRRP